MMKCIDLEKRGIHVQTSWGMRILLHVYLHANVI